MAFDLRHLRPGELCRLLNSTPLGEVISERRLHNHRQRAGFRIGDDKQIDLFRYIAWLVRERHAPKPEPTGDPYAAQKERARARSAAISEAGRDIGDLPPVVNPQRRTRAAKDFRFFCDSYFPLTFHLPWSPDHLKVLAKIEQAVLQGGLFALAMPRSSGKALALDTPLATPSGWTTMGQVQIGDALFDERGNPCRVTAATEAQLDRPCYRVRFSDGESIVCDAEHLWTVEDCWSRRNPLTLTTREIAGRVFLPQSRANPERRYRVPITAPLNTPVAELEIDPYVLGYWLGDGTARCNCITVHRDDLKEVEAEIRKCGETYHVRGCIRNAAVCVIGKGHKANPHKIRCLRTAIAALDCRVPTERAAEWSGLTRKTVEGIRRLGRWDSIRQGRQSSLHTRLKFLNLLRNKHIPRHYLRAAPWQRLALLQGLMDTDGSINHQGKCEITLKDDPLGRDVAELLTGLGLKWHCSTK